MRKIKIGLLCLFLFGVWTHLVNHYDVAVAANTSTEIGLSTLNFWFHELTGVHFELYVIKIG